MKIEGQNWPFSDWTPPPHTNTRHPNPSPLSTCHWAPIELIQALSESCCQSEVGRLIQSDIVCPSVQLHPGSCVCVCVRERERECVCLFWNIRWMWHFHGVPLRPNSQTRTANLGHFLHLSNPLTRHLWPAFIVAPCLEMAEPNYTPYHRQMQLHSSGMRSVTICRPTCDANANPVKHGWVQHNPPGTT